MIALPSTIPIYLALHFYLERTMTRMFFLAALAGYLALSPVITAQIVDATVCEIVSNPQSFDGKLVRVKGVVTGRFRGICDQGFRMRPNS